MSPRINFTREEIITAAKNVIRDGGSSNLTARSIARAMGGSTQPIYRVFGTIEELEQDLLNSVRGMAYELMLSTGDRQSHFLSIGLGYLRFSREEPELFKYAFIEGDRSITLDYSKEPFQGVLEKMKRDSELKKLDDPILENLFKDMWIYTHGLASQVLINPGLWSEEICYNMLFSMGGRLIAHELMGIDTGSNYQNILKETGHENCSS